MNAVDLTSPEYQGYYGQSGYHYSGSDAETWEPQKVGQGTGSQSKRSEKKD